MATTVRVDERVAAQLREIALEEHRSMGQVIAEAVARYQKERFWDGVHADFVRLRSDPDAWRSYQEEIVLFTGGSGGTLDNEPPYYTREEEDEIRAEYARTVQG